MQQSRTTYPCVFESRQSLLSSPQSAHHMETRLATSDNGFGIVAAVTRSSPANQDSSGWWTQFDSDGQRAHAQSNFHTRSQPSAPARQVNHTLPAQPHHTAAQHPAWLLQPTPQGNQNPQMAQDPGHRLQSLGPGSRHMSDPGLDLNHALGSSSTPGARSTSSASAGNMHDAFVTQSRDHPHADSWPQHPTRPRGPHLTQQVQAQRNSLGALWERTQPRDEVHQGIDQMQYSPEVQVKGCGTHMWGSFLKSSSDGGSFVM